MSNPGSAGIGVLDSERKRKMAKQGKKKGKPPAAEGAAIPLPKPTAPKAEVAGNLARKETIQAAMESSSESSGGAVPFKRKLEALGYPRWECFNAEGMPSPAIPLHFATINPLWSSIQST